MITKDISLDAFILNLDNDAFVFKRYMHLPKFTSKRYFAPGEIKGAMFRDSDAGPVIFLDDLKEGFDNPHLIH